MVLRTPLSRPRAHYAVTRLHDAVNWPLTEMIRSSEDGGVAIGFGLEKAWESLGEFENVMSF